jgi:hypothetical protein
MARPTCGLPFPAVAFEPRCIVATSRVENGAEGAGYNLLYCIKADTGAGRSIDRSCRLAFRVAKVHSATYGTYRFDGAPGISTLPF